MAKILLYTKKTTLGKSFVSISKAAKFLQVSPDTLRNWEKEGKLLPSRTHGGARRYSATELINLKKEIRPFTRKKGLVSISQAAQSLKVSADTLRGWDKKGLIEAQRSKGGARRFTRDEIQRLQKELGINPIVISAQKEVGVAIQVPKSSQEIHNLTFPWFRISFSLITVGMIIATGWFFVSYIGPLEKKIGQTSKLVAETVQSLESLQRGVLGIQMQPSPRSSDSPGNSNTTSANYVHNIVYAAAEAPLVLDPLSNRIGCISCLTKDSSYISILTNSDGTLALALDNKTATISLSLDHANNWSALQTFQGSIGVGVDSVSQLFQLNPSSSNPVVMTSTGNVGIGITSPVNKLEVAGGQTIGEDYAGIYTAPENGLLVQGNVGIGISAPSYSLDVGGGARFGCEDAGWNNGPATDCSDIAEVYRSDGRVDIGELVAIGSQPDVVTKSMTSYQKNVIGVYSTSPGLLVGGQTILGGGSNLGDNKIPVALSGRVPVKVSDENGPIQAGDYLTSSSTPGVAMKATKVGPVIGQALESFAPFVSESGSSETEDHLVYIKTKIGKIMAFINISYADPGNFLASLTMDNYGNLIIPKIVSGSIVLDPSLSSASSQLAVINSQLSIRSDPDYLSSGPELASNDNNYIDLSGEIASLEDRIKTQELKIKDLEDQVYELVQETSGAGLNSGNVGIGTSVNQSATPSIEVTGNRLASRSESQATTSATLSVSESASQQVTKSAQAVVNSVQQSTPPALLTTDYELPAMNSLELTPPDILLATSSAQLTNLIVTDNLSSDKLFEGFDIKASGDLSVFGKTMLATTAIAGDLTVDGTLSVNGNSVNVIGAAECSGDKTACGILYLQNSPLAYQVDFFNGQVTIDKSGSLRAQSVVVSGFKVVANKISGSGKIESGAKSADIENLQVSPSSRILITPTSETNLVLAVTEKVEGKKFTVSVAQATQQDIIFDWFIIGEER